MRRRLILAAALLLVVAGVAIGLAQAPDQEPAGPASSAEQDAAVVARSPPPLRALYARGGELQRLQGDQIVDLIRGLRGYPVVVNKWASWCGPCREEFPMLRRLSAKYGDRVAFIGLNSGDTNADARRFLARNPTIYPHLIDPDEGVADALRAGGTYPSTVFFDRESNIVTVGPGPFPTQARFEEAIRRYALATDPKRPRGG